jgi:hypothetical protein
MSNLSNIYESAYQDKMDNLKHNEDFIKNHNKKVGTVAPIMGGIKGGLMGIGAGSILSGSAHPVPLAIGGLIGAGLGAGIGHLQGKSAIKNNERILPFIQHSRETTKKIRDTLMKKLKREPTKGEIEDAWDKLEQEALMAGFDIS